MPDELKNTGVLLGSGTKSLWLGGTIPFEEVLSSGDWRPFLPSGEKQKNPTETMACVSFSDLNCLEIQAKQRGLETNWSDRFIAKLSGTTHQGNYLDKVADTVRQYGLVTEEVWPSPAGLTWDQYYSDIPQEVINKAVRVEIAYESIVAGENELRYHLKQAPIQIILTNANPHHAVTLVAIEDGRAYYFDHYSPFLKFTKVSNIHKSALKIVLKGIPMENIVIYKNGSEYQLAHKAKSEEGFAQQLFDAGATHLLKDGKPNFAEIDKIAHVL